MSIVAHDRRSLATAPEFPCWRVVDRKLHPLRVMNRVQKEIEDYRIWLCEDGSVEPRIHDSDDTHPVIACLNGPKAKLS